MQTITLAAIAFIAGWHAQSVRLLLSFSRHRRWICLATLLTALAASPACAAEYRVVVVSMSGCPPCAKLKAAIAADPELKSLGIVTYDKDDAANKAAWKDLGIRAYPTLFVRAPDGRVVFQRVGFSGNSQHLAAEIRAAINRGKR